MQRKLSYTAAIATLSLAALGAAYASSSDQNDALGIADAKISLTQAINAAEQHVGGKAASAEFEQDRDGAVFEVEVVKGTQVLEVKVDPSSGQVLSAVNDEVDSDGDEDHEGGRERGEADD